MKEEVPCPVLPENHLETFLSANTSFIPERLLPGQKREQSALSSRRGHGSPGEACTRPLGLTAHSARLAPPLILSNSADRSTLQLRTPTTAARPPAGWPCIHQPRLEAGGRASWRHSRGLGESSEALGDRDPVPPAAVLIGVQGCLPRWVTAFPWSSLNPEMTEVWGHYKSDD